MVLALVAIVGLGLVAYSYLVYPLVLLGLAGLVQVWRDARYVYARRTRRRKGMQELPAVGIVISAFNEERDIGARIENLLSLDYPPGLLRIYVGSDGSSDGTERVIRGCTDPRVACRAFAENRGKSSVLNDLVAEVKEPLVVFSDANSAFDRQALVRHPEYLFGTSGIMAFTYLSHKVLRWIAPHLLLLSLAASAILSLSSSAWFAFTLAQLACYGLAGMAFLASGRAGIMLPGPLRVPAFLFALNWAFLVASARFAAGRYRGGWQRSER